MKGFSRLLLLLVIISFVAACDSGPNIVGGANDGSMREFTVSDVPSDQMPYILADTITPPSNPMVPEDLSSLPTFVGTLQMFQINGIDDLAGQYFCAITLYPPISSRAYSYSNLYLLDYGTENLVRFDHSMLQPCVVGDTIYVTGEPKVIAGGLALGVTMRFVQPN